jgi:hypothetical protein
MSVFTTDTTSSPQTKGFRRATNVSKLGQVRFSITYKIDEVVVKGSQNRVVSLSSSISLKGYELLQKILHRKQEVFKAHQKVEICQESQFLQASQARFSSSLAHLVSLQAAGFLHGGTLKKVQKRPHRI